MIAFTHLSVRRKLIRLVLLASVLALACVAVTVAVYEVRTFQPRTLAGLEAEAAILEEVLGAPLDFGLTTVAETGLAKHCADRAILRAALYDTNTLFAAYQRTDVTTPAPPAPAHAGHAFTTGRLSLWRPVHNNDGVLIGYLFLEEALPPLHARLPQYAIMTVAVSVALMIVGFVLMRGLRHNVLDPLARLVQTTDQVIRTNDYRTRAAVERADELGQLAGAFNQMIEVIGQRDADLRHASARIQNVFNAATEVGIVATDTQGTVTVFNSGAERMLGYRSEEVVGKLTPATWHLPEERAVREAEVTKAFGRPIQGFDVFVEPVRQGHHEAREWTFVRKDGSRLPVYLVITAARDAAGAIIGFLGMFNDITERQRAEAALRESEQKFRTVVQNAQAIIFILDQRGVFQLSEGQALAKLGLKPGQVVGQSALEVYRDNPSILDGIQRALGGETAHVTNVVGDAVFDTVYSPYHGPQGKLAGVIGIAMDITERKLAEDALAESRHLYGELVSSVPLGVYRLGVRAGREYFFEYVSDRFCEVTGTERAKVLADAQVAFDIIHPDDRKEFTRLNAAVIRDQTPFSWEGRAVVGGQTRWLHIESRPTVTADQSAHWTGVAFDITERKQAEEGLRKSQAGLEEAQALAKIGSWELDVATNRGVWSREMCRLHGRLPEQGDPSFEEFMALVHPEDRERLLAHYQAQLRGEANEDSIYRIIRGDGKARHIQVQVARITDATGRVCQLRGTCTDITEQLQAGVERARLEEQLLQAQKMEAIGQLSGGVAHDFNNLLTIIEGHVTLMRLSSGLTPELQESITEIGQATTRAANLTRQLLAFSRRQTLQIKTLDLSEVVANMTRMLQRIVGEDIQMHLHYAAQPILVRADAGMVEQVLLNLVVNARDAMPRGGRLVIATVATEFTVAQAAKLPQASSGGFGCLAVSDTGCGIPPELLPKIFEPFFTTKDVGKGTGLGLATVYGIAQQHQGWVSVDSEVGIGTTFRIYLPATNLATHPRVPELPAAQPTPVAAPDSAATILLVEDEPALRMLGCKILRRLGYAVLEAPTGVAAVEVWKQHQAQIRLLITDMVMPDGMSGRELALRLHRDALHLPVIYTSGYSAEIAGKDFPLQEGVNFLAKPFSPAQLAETVHTSLAAAASRTGA